MEMTHVMFLALILKGEKWDVRIKEANKREGNVSAHSGMVWRDQLVFNHESESQSVIQQGMLRQ